MCFRNPLMTIALLSTCILSAFAASAPTIRVVAVDADIVGLYEKIEITLDLTAEYSNPYDPDQIDVSALFTAPSGKQWQIWGFYDETVTPPAWKIRFAPNEEGLWRFAARARDVRGRAADDERKFTAVESPHHGWVRASPHNERYLIHDDGTSFYGVGVHYVTMPDDREPYVTQQGLDEIAAHKGNFFSFQPSLMGIAPWLLRRTDGVAGVDRDGLHFNPKNVARLDQVISWCEKRELITNMRLILHHALSEYTWNTHWDKNPYNKVCDKAENFYTDALTTRLVRDNFRYIIARWGYSRSVGFWNILNEATGTDGWTKDRASLEKWCLEQYLWFKKNDPFRRLASSTKAGKNEDWVFGYSRFDTCSKNVYEKSMKTWPYDPDNPLTSSVHNFAGSMRHLWTTYKKPSWVNATGGKKIHFLQHLPEGGVGTREYVNVFHNAMWACLSNGSAVSPKWWKYPDSFDEKMMDQLVALARFVADIDFAHHNWSHALANADGADAYVMAAGTMAFGWIRENSPDLDASVAGRAIRISGIAAGPCRVQWYDTWAATPIASESAVVKKGQLHLTVPKSVKQKDVAVKIMATIDELQN